jgi:hypothetical protein
MSTLTIEAADSSERLIPFSKLHVISHLEYTALGNHPGEGRDKQNISVYVESYLVMCTYCGIFAQRKNCEATETAVASERLRNNNHF